MASLAEPPVHQVAGHFFAIAYPYVHCLGTGQQGGKIGARIFEMNVHRLACPRTKGRGFDSDKKLHA
jgi:hypothetical protein